jgi:thiol-disulfide isomerase/thioredoxin
MGIISLGPLVMAADRFAALLGIGAFLLVASIIARRKGDHIAAWAGASAAGGVVAARLGHVIEHLGSFAQEPLRAFAVWQGGFSFLWAIPVVVVLTLRRLPGVRERGWVVPPVVIGLLVWTVTLHLANASTGDGRPLPNLALEQLNGPAIALSTTNGRPRVLNLWATWCPPCRREMPLLAEAARAMPDVDFLFVNQGEARSRISKYLEGAKLDLPHVVLDSTSEVSRHFQVRGIPVTLFFGSDGRMRHLHLGEVSREHLSSYIVAISKRP